MDQVHELYLSRPSEDSVATVSEASTHHASHAWPTREHEAAAAPWHPPEDVSGPHYTDDAAAIGVAKGSRPSTPGLPESPTLPALDGHQFPVPPRTSLAAPVSQPTWKPQRTSVALTSEPPASPRQTDAEFAPYSAYQLSDQARATKEGYFTRISRVASFASRGSGGSSSGSIPRASLSMAPSIMSEARPDSASPFPSSARISSPTPMSPLPSSPPPEYRRTWAPPASANGAVPDVPTPSRHSPHSFSVEITPKTYMTEKGKGSEILHIDTSPTGSFVATKHGNKCVKLWSTAKNALHGTIKVKSYMQPSVRSREYFIRSHAILSESASLIGIATHFGLTLEIYNFSKPGSGAKKVQVIEDAHRWAASQLDASHNDYAGLAVYRPKTDRIDRFFLARHPNTKAPFRADPNHTIDLQLASLPFLPKFPELAYSTSSPYLIAAAGPRPGDAVPNKQAGTPSTLLIAWHLKPVSPVTLHAANPPTQSLSLIHI